MPPISGRGAGVRSLNQPLRRRVYLPRQGAWTSYPSLGFFLHFFLCFAWARVRMEGISLNRCSDAMGMVACAGNILELLSSLCASIRTFVDVTSTQSTSLSHPPSPPPLLSTTLTHLRRLHSPLTTNPVPSSHPALLPADLSFPFTPPLLGLPLPNISTSSLGKS